MNDFLVSYGNDGRRYSIWETGLHRSEFVFSGRLRNVSVGKCDAASIDRALSPCKSMSLSQHPEIVNQTSVPQVFDIAAVEVAFSNIASQRKAWAC